MKSTVGESSLISAGSSVHTLGNGSRHQLQCISVSVKFMSLNPTDTANRAHSFPSKHSLGPGFPLFSSLDFSLILCYSAFWNLLKNIINIIIESVPRYTETNIVPDVDTVSNLKHNSFNPPNSSWDRHCYSHFTDEETMELRYKAGRGHWANEV